MYNKVRAKYDVVLGGVYLRKGEVSLVNAVTLRDYPIYFDLVDELEGVSVIKMMDVPQNENEKYYRTKAVNLASIFKHEASELADSMVSLFETALSDMPTQFIKEESEKLYPFQGDDWRLEFNRFVHYMGGVGVPKKTFEEEYSSFLRYRKSVEDMDDISGNARKDTEKCVSCLKDSPDGIIIHKTIGRKHPFCSECANSGFYNKNIFRYNKKVLQEDGTTHER